MFRSAGTILRGGHRCTFRITKGAKRHIAFCGSQGVMEVMIDGRHSGEVAFVKSQSVRHQSIVFTSRKLRKGKHVIQLINKAGTIALDALVVK